MFPAIEDRYDQERGCGWRRPGLYLVAEGLSAPCGRLPLPLAVCPTCHGGIKPSRGWQWVDADALAAQMPCDGGRNNGRSWSLDCAHCPLGGKLGKAGLLWVGGKYYPTPDDFTAEAAAQGVSRRIKVVPKGFEVGKTWVLLAHREAIQVPCLLCDGNGQRPAETGDGLQVCECDRGYVCHAAVFHAFKPSAIEYVVKGDETEEDLVALRKRGISPIRVRRQQEPCPKTSFQGE